MLAVANDIRELDMLCRCLNNFQSLGTSKTFKMLAPFLFALGTVPLTLGLSTIKTSASSGEKDDECTVITKRMPWYVAITSDLQHTEMLTMSIGVILRRQKSLTILRRTYV